MPRLVFVDRDAPSMGLQQLSGASPAADASASLFVSLAQHSIGTLSLRLICLFLERDTREVFRIIVESVGLHPVETKKLWREVLALDLAGLRELCGALPRAVAQERTLARAEALKARLEATGASVRIEATHEPR